MNYIFFGGGASAGNQVAIGNTEPTDENVIVWIDTSEEEPVDIPVYADDSDLLGGKAPEYYAVASDVTALQSELSTTRGELSNTKTTVANLSSEVAATKKSVAEGKELLANSLSGKGADVSSSDTFATMASAIDSLILGSGNALPEQVLEGATFTNNDGVEYTGTMPNIGKVTQELVAGGTYTVPKGYHDGTGVITSKDLSSQTTGTATASDMMTGTTAWVNGQKVTGTLVTNTCFVTTTEPTGSTGEVGDLWLVVDA